MHTVVLGWFGASAVWFLPLVWRLVRSVLPGGAGLRGPGTIRLWLGFVGVLVASCALEAALIDIAGVNAFGHLVAGGLAKLAGHIAAPVAMAVLFVAALPWLLDFRWRGVLAWADLSLGLGLGIGPGRGDDDTPREERRSRRAQAAETPLPQTTLSATNGAQPRRGERWTRPTVWRPPATTTVQRGTAAGGGSAAGAMAAAGTAQGATPAGGFAAGPAVSRAEPKFSGSSVAGRAGESALSMPSRTAEPGGAMPLRSSRMAEPAGAGMAAPARASEPVMSPPAAMPKPPAPSDASGEWTRTEPVAPAEWLRNTPSGSRSSATSQGSGAAAADARARSTTSAARRMPAGIDNAESWRTATSARNVPPVPAAGVVRPPLHASSSAVAAAAVVAQHGFATPSGSAGHAQPFGATARGRGGPPPVAGSTAARAAAAAPAARTVKPPRPYVWTPRSPQAPAHAQSSSASPVAAGSSSAPAFSRPAAASNDEPPRTPTSENVAATLRAIEENAARWTALAGANPARRAGMGNAEPPLENGAVDGASSSYAIGADSVAVNDGPPDVVSAVSSVAPDAASDGSAALAETPPALPEAPLTPKPAAPIQPVRDNDGTTGRASASDGWPAAENGLAPWVLLDDNEPAGTPSAAFDVEPVASVETTRSAEPLDAVAPDDALPFTDALPSAALAWQPDVVQLSQAGESSLPDDTTRHPIDLASDEPLTPAHDESDAADRPSASAVSVAASALAADAIVSPAMAADLPDTPANLSTAEIVAVPHADSSAAAGAAAPAVATTTDTELPSVAAAVLAAVPATGAAPVAAMAASPLPGEATPLVTPSAAIDTLRSATADSGISTDARVEETSAQTTASPTDNAHSFDPAPPAPQEAARAEPPVTLAPHDTATGTPTVAASTSPAQPDATDPTPSPESLAHSSSPSTPRAEAPGSAATTPAASASQRPILAAPSATPLLTLASMPVSPPSVAASLPAHPEPATAAAALPPSLPATTHAAQPPSASEEASASTNSSQQPHVPATPSANTATQPPFVAATPTPAADPVAQQPNISATATLAANPAAQQPSATATPAPAADPIAQQPSAASPSAVANVIAEQPPTTATPGSEPGEPTPAPAEAAPRPVVRGHAPTTFEFRPPAASAVELPGLDLLDRASSEIEPISEEKLAQTGQLIEQRLQEFKVPVAVVGASAGPVITRFEIEPALGVRGSQIVGLMKDLSRGLGLTSIRVVETIPGKTCMGLELPNARRQMIRLSEILESGPYQRSPSKLTIAMGKDIVGLPVVTDLAKAPHMLVAGTTGSGKSVAINAMILSLLYKATPAEVRLIMIDPKMLELSVYEGIPHLLAPVVTDMKLAANALNWCVGEMEKRYRLMSAVGVRNLAGFNQKIRDAQAHEKKIGNPFSLTPDDPEPLSTLPMIVVVIDELADLMMVAGKKIEELIARLAQKARAAGIHLILATQRPSVDVITGLIKANIPTRVAFQVSSKIDSRTILDQMGAESLLGQGDMLFLPPGTGYPQRVHGAFVADEEVHSVVEYLKQFGEPEYIEGILDGPATEGAQQDLFGETPDAEADPLYDEAVAFVVRTRRASISSVQRQLRIGYNRAARLVEQMEAAGLVSPMGINGSREVLAPGAAE